MVDAAFVGLPDRRRDVERVTFLVMNARAPAPSAARMISGVALAERTTTLTVGMLLAERLEAAAPVGGPQTELEGDDVRSPALHQGEHLGARVRHPGDLDVLDALECPTKTFEHEPVVVGDQNLHFRILRDPLRIPAPVPARGIVGQPDRGQWAHQALRVQEPERGCWQTWTATS